MSDTNGENPYGQPNNPDPYGDAPQTNPYGTPPPSPSTPPPANPYGAASYAAPGVPGYGGPAYGAPVKTDGMAIAALVSSLLGCLCGLPFLVGLILGIIALGRTKDGKAKGRGMAIAGIVIGAVGIVVSIIALVVLVFVGINQVVTPSNAKVGQCVDITESGNKVSMVKQSCTETHDAQIIATATVTADNLDAARGSTFCHTLVDAATLNRLAQVPGLHYESVTEDPSNTQVGDHIVCYVRHNNNLTTDLLKTN